MNLVKDRVMVVSNKFNRFNATIKHSSKKRVSDIVNDERQFIVFTDCQSPERGLSGTIILSKRDIISIHVEDN